MKGAHDMRMPTTLIAVALLAGCQTESPVSPTVTLLETVHAAQTEDVAAAAVPEPEPTPEATPEPPNPFPAPTPTPTPPGPECEWIAQPATPVWDDWGPCVSDHGDDPICAQVRTGWTPIIEQNSCTVEVRYSREEHLESRECPCP